MLVEVSGCPTTCLHCWALGGDYGAMPLDGAAFVLEELARFCGELGTAANVFLTKPALRDFDRLLGALRELGLGELWIGPARYTPTPGAAL